MYWLTTILPSLHSATVVVPLSVHVAMLGVFMFLNGIAIGGLDNGTTLRINFVCSFLDIHSVMLLHRALPYSRKYRRELNLAVDPKIAIARRILADLNLAVVI